MFVVLCTTTDCQCTVTVTVAGNVASGSISSAVAGGYRIVDDLGDVAVDNRQYNLRKRTKKHTVSSPRYLPFPSRKAQTTRLASFGPVFVVSAFSKPSRR
jgi:hypothetical protein